MAYKQFLLIVQFAITLCNQCNCTKIKGYYWRDFRGRTPRDALEGGEDYNGDPIYIGQTNHLNDVVPGKIYKHDPFLYYTIRGSHKTIKNVMILCTETPEEFVWVVTDRNLTNIPEYIHLVIGGNQKNADLYIGRVFYNLETVVGKVIRNNAFYAHTEGKRKFLTFEVLTYRPTKPQLEF